VRLATKDDAAMIADFLGDFFDQSEWSLHMAYHKPKALSYLEHALGSQYAIYVLGMEGSRMVGVCSYHIFGVFTDPMAVMDETYTTPEYRRTDLGRRLVATVIDLARGDGCKVINFPICSGMPSQNSLMNMVGRHFGAEPVGMIFRKVL
jgi:GNAT superfamily N-acetyltransferase